MLLPREHLPLSSLDLSQPHGDLPASRLFESKIKILDLEGRLGSNVLLARSETTRVVYAVERESNGLYVLCKLGSWMDIEALSQSATVVCAERLRSSKPAKPNDATAAPLTTPSLYNESKRRRLAIDEIQSLVRKRSMSVVEKDLPSQASPPTATETSLLNEDATQNEAPMPQHSKQPAEPAVESGPSASNGPVPPTPGAAPSADAHSQPNAEDIFQNIRTQYMEALYHSKVRYISPYFFFFSLALTKIGFVGVFCKRPPLQGQGSIPSELGLRPGHE
jgi:DNA replication regulator SLD3